MAESFTIQWHQSPEDVHRAMWEPAAVEQGISYDEVIKDGHVEAQVVDGEHVTLTYDEVIEAMRQQKYWGFVDTKTNAIHAWAADDAPPDQIIHLLAHEIGHITGERLVDDLEEEERADTYGHVAATAYLLFAQRDQATAQLPLEATEADKTREVERMKRTLNDLGKIIHDMVVAQQAAWIEWQHGRGAEVAMAWIQNGLVGPGHIPDEDEPWGKEAQAWYDANCSNALPPCFCGRPSNIGWMGKGFCCNAHYMETKQASIDAAPLRQESPNEQ